ncbi:MAG: glutamate 5-kinase [Desulfovibrio sp.]|jgi:glutamate 5-kinase|nr:glutamate 5-kinase [Desulfovibrio sp.]
MLDRREDLCGERRGAVSQARAVVVKVGSAVLSDARGLNTPVMSSLARQMALLQNSFGEGCSPRRLVLVSSGAVAAGRAVLSAAGQKLDAANLAARQAAAAVGQGQLMRAWDAAFAAHGMTTAQILLTRDDLRSRERFLNIRNTVAALLDWNVLPIVNENDTVSVSELKFGDNDCLASLLVNLTGADLFVNLTSAPGVQSADPRLKPDAPVMECIENVTALDLKRLCGGKTEAGSGGMYSKLLAARRAAQIGVPTLILPGRAPHVLARAFGLGAGGGTADEAESRETHQGTWVRPAEHAIPRRKFWMAYQSEPAGAVAVDTGAADALLHKGGSLLPVGVRSVEGTFQKGALVRVLHEGRSFGVGLSNYSAAQLKKIMGLRRHEVAIILGDAHYPEAIHRDNLLLDAAI